MSRSPQAQASHESTDRAALLPHHEGEGHSGEGEFGGFVVPMHAKREGRPPINDQVELLKIEPHHLRSVAEVHVKAFPSSVLTRLGIEVVRRYYEWQLVGPHDHEFLGLLQVGILRGYAVGGVSRAATGGFVRRNAALLCWKVVTHPWLLLGGRFRDRLATAIQLLSWKIKKQKAAVVPKSKARSFGILAIAVDPEAQGHGFGGILMDRLEAAALGRNYPRMHLSVAVDNTQGIAFYERLGWKKCLTKDGWRGAMEKDISSPADAQDKPGANRLNRTWRVNRILTLNQDQDSLR